MDNFFSCLHQNFFVILVCLKKKIDQSIMRICPTTLALLVLLSTPLGAHLPSPAEFLQQTRFRTTLPMFVSSPPNTKDVWEKLQKRQAVAAENYNETAIPKPELVQGQRVRLFRKMDRCFECTNCLNQSMSAFSL